MPPPMACHAGDILAATARCSPPPPRPSPTAAWLPAPRTGAASTATTPRRRANGPRACSPPALETPVAILFGSEDNGLSLEDLALCTQFIRIPSSEAYKSLNLAMSVMVCAYELFVASGTFEPPQERSAECPSAMREAMFAKWRKALLDIGFMTPDTADHMMLGIRRILSRGTLTEKDVQILLGMAAQTQWAARHIPPKP
jgi:tRNA/rRNA methyltransferase